MDAFDIPLVCAPQQNDVIPMMVSLAIVIGLVWLYRRLFNKR